MATKRISIISEVVLPIVIYVVTIALFFAFMPEEAGALFWINLVYTLFLETCLFGWLIWVRKSDTKDVSSLASIAVGMYGSYYIIAGVAIMVFYSLLVTLGVPIGLKWYIAILVIITLVWIVPAIFLVEADSTHKQNMEHLQQNNRQIINFSNLMKSALGKAENLSQTQKTRLMQEIDSISPSRLSDASAEQLRAYIESVPSHDYDYLMTEIKNLKTTM
ncbi:MAG: hypothetical protein J5588_05030 [Bacteroidales bacterium]|nr:hypothetical protein [Bacteroidales bacterium]